MTDKRRFNEKGERVDLEGNSTTEQASDPDKGNSAAQSVASTREAELEAQLKSEIQRREAAEAKLVGVQAKFDELKSQLERETAEMRSRLMKTLEERAKQSQYAFLETLLPVLDNLNLAISASETDPSLEHLRNGVIGTARSFEQALLNVGVEPIPSVGMDFNPELHEAVDVVEVEEEADGKITAEYRRGYKFGEQLLRPAKVQVGKARVKSAAEPQA
ncbi:MAG TPA: nucleotide exchange factor GrpE [Pyrinomonadaceae bacterium]|nr:nucleotide exchange factor GrpE [Pyrinomonadaceae bacterium]